MASAITNLSPATTFLIAVIFRMEKIDIRSSRSRAKLLGTLIAISGAMVSTLYQGPVIFSMSSSPDSAKQLLLSQPPNLLFGGLLMFISVIIASIWRVIQTATAREFPDRLANVFFFCLFGTLQCLALSPFLVQNPNAWFLHTRIEIIAVSFGGVIAIALRINVLTWCLEKKGPVYAAMFSPLSILLAVIMGVTFLGDLLHLGSAIGGIIVAAGFYTVMWGQAKEKNNLRVVMEVDENVSDQTSPLLSSENESRC